MRTYYDLLNLGTDAGKGDIKRAFRELAKRLHPDVCGPEPSDARAHGPRGGGFLEILAAYETLVDDRKRKAYDSALRALGRNAGNGPRSIPRSRVSFALSLREVAALRAPSRNGNRRRRAFPNPKGYHVCVGLTEEELAGGARVDIDVPAHVVCPVCRGDRIHCAFCSSTGQVLKAVPVAVSIPRHLGHGEVFAVPLRSLRGRGYAFFMIDTLLVKVRVLEVGNG